MFKKTSSMYQKFQAESSSSEYQSYHQDNHVTFMKLTKIQSEDQRFMLNETFQLSSEDQNQLKTFADQLNSMAYSKCQQIKQLHSSAAQNDSKSPEITKKRRKTFNLIKNVENQPTVDEKVKSLLKYNQKYSYQKYKILHNPLIQKKIILENGEEVQTFINPEIITILDYQNESIISTIKVKQYIQFASKIKNDPKVDIKIPNFALVKIQVQIQKLSFKGFIGLQNGKNMKILLQNTLGNSQKMVSERNQQLQLKYYLVFDINQPSKLKFSQQNRNQKKDSPQKNQIKYSGMNRQFGVQQLQKHVFKPFMLFKNEQAQKPIEKQKSSYEYIQTYLPQIKQYIPYRQVQLSPLKKQQEKYKLEPYIEANKNQPKKLSNSYRNIQSKLIQQQIKAESLPTNSQNQFPLEQNRRSDFQKSKKNQKSIQIDFQSQLKNQKQSQINKFNSNQRKQKVFSFGLDVSQKETIPKPNSKMNQVPYFNIKKTKAKSRQKSIKSISEHSQPEGENQFKYRSNTAQNFPIIKKSPQKEYRIKSKPKNIAKQRKHSYQRINPRLTLQTYQSDLSSRKSYNSSQMSNKYTQKRSKSKKHNQPVQHVNSNTFNPNQLKEILLKSTQKGIKRTITQINYRLSINNIALDMDKFQLGGKFIKMFIQSRFRKKIIFGTNIIEMTSQKIIWSLNNCRFQEIGDYDMFHMEVYQILKGRSEDEQNQIGFCGQLIISCSELIYLSKSQQDHENKMEGKLTLYNGCLVKSKRIVGNCMLSFSLSKDDLRESGDGQSSTQTIPQHPDQQLQQLNENYSKNKVGGYSKIKLNHQKKQHKFRNRLYSQENVTTPQKTKQKRTLNIQIDQLDNSSQDSFQSPPKNRKYSSHLQRGRHHDSPTIKAMKQNQEYMNSIDQEEDLNTQN